MRKRIDWLVFTMCFTAGEISAEWEIGVIVPMSKVKGEVYDPERYRSITLLSQDMTLLERIFDARARNIVKS